MIRHLRFFTIALVLTTFSLLQQAQAVLLLYEPFNYPVNNFLSATTVGAENTTTSPIGNLAPNFNNWYGTGEPAGAGGYQTANDGQIVASDLTVAGLAKPSATTNALTLGGQGYTFRLSFNSSTSTANNKTGPNPTDTPDPLAGTDNTLQASDTGGTGYYSIAFKVTDITGMLANGGTLLGFNAVIGAQTINPTTVGAGLTIRPKAGGSAGQFELGVLKNGGATSIAGATWDTSDTFTTNSTIFVVGKYQTVGPLQPVAPGGTDDIASLWINPAPATFGGFDPAGAFVNSAGDDIPTNAGTNNHTLQSFILRQNGTATDNRIPPGIIYDELRVGTNWADVTPPAVVTGVPGDYNGNGVVDAADYVLWRSGGPLQNEIDTPGTVNAADYTAWRSKFGNTSGAGAGLGSGSVVPEPATFGLILMSAIAFFSRRSISSRAS